MDAWLTDDIKTQLHRPFLEAAGYLASRIARRRYADQQDIDERALTEDFLDKLNTGTPENVWGPLPAQLRDVGIYLSTAIRKSTKEFQTGADLGITLERRIHSRGHTSSASYAALFQAKKIDRHGRIPDFFHTVASSKLRQSHLMLDITPASFYLLYAEPSALRFYSAFEPTVFLRGGTGCSSPVWGGGCFEFSGSIPDFLPSDELRRASGLLVVPAMAVEAAGGHSTSISLNDLLPNCLPFWYWFVELFMPGFVGDSRDSVRRIAQNVSDPTRDLPKEGDNQFHVRYSFTTRIGNG